MLKKLTILFTAIISCLRLFSVDAQSQESILVTGGFGYIGSAVAYTLHQQGFDVIILDKEVAPKFEWATVYQGCIGNAALLKKIFTQHTISCVMHFAALVEVGESVTNPSAYYQNNVVRTLTLLNTMIKHKIKKFIFSSSCAAYGNPVVLPLNEQHSTNPESPYGWTKLMVDQILNDFDRAYNLKYVCLRYFNAAGAIPEAHLGPQRVIHVIPIILQKIIKNQPFTINGDDYPTPDGTCVRDFIHIKDIAYAHMKALEYLKAGNSSNIFNLGSGTGYSVKEIIKATEHATGKKLTYTMGPRRPGDTSSLVADARKAERVLGWKPLYSDLENIIQSAWDWELAKNKLNVSQNKV